MITKHEAIAKWLVDEAVAAAITEVQRDYELPADCPPAGIANFVFDAPREIGRQLGSGVREISRMVQIEVVVTGETQVERIQRFEAALVGYGAFLAGLDRTAVNLDHMEIGEPIEPDVIPMQGASSLRGATIPVELLYETSNNPMETAP